MLFGVQLFGIWKNSAYSADETLAQLAQAGYALAEPCVWLDDPPAPLGSFWSMDMLAQMQPLMASHGMAMPSCHVFAADLFSEFERIAQLVTNYGLKQIVIKCIPDADDGFAQRCMTLARRLESLGAQLLLHNGPGAAQALERMLIACEGHVFAQADVGWLMADGVDAVAFLARHHTLVRSIHYKDFTVHGAEVPAGCGALDLLSCFQFARAKGIPQLVDLDVTGGDLFGELTDIHSRLVRLRQRRDGSRSILCTLDVDTGAVTDVKRFDGVIEAPNWSPDGDALIYNADGRLWRCALADASVSMLESGSCDQCNNDHVICAATRQIILSHNDRETGLSLAYALPLEGGEPRRITPKGHSYVHGVSPDGQETVYCAFRNGTGDIRAIRTDGGEEWALTHGEGFNDGPEYAPDGKRIWFNSTRSGLMQVWRMERDGSNPVQMTFSQANNWFPHLSLDGSRVAYLAYHKDHLEPWEHLPNMQVELWLMNADGSQNRRLLSFFGGQGSINVNSWSPDGCRIAFVRYEY